MVGRVGVGRLVGMGERVGINMRSVSCVELRYHCKRTIAVSLGAMPQPATVSSAGHVKPAEQLT